LSPPSRSPASSVSASCDRSPNCGGWSTQTTGHGPFLVGSQLGSLVSGHGPPPGHPARATVLTASVTTARPILSEKRCIQTSFVPRGSVQMLLMSLYPTSAPEPSEILRIRPSLAIPAAHVTALPRRYHIHGWCLPCRTRAGARRHDDHQGADPGAGFSCSRSNDAGKARPARAPSEARPIRRSSLRSRPAAIEATKRRIWARYLSGLLSDRPTLTEEDVATLYRILDAGLPRR
jgi:hypothetical protein